MSLHAHKQADGQLKNSVEREKIYKQKTTVDIDSGYHQARGHEQ